MLGVAVHIASLHTLAAGGRARAPVAVRPTGYTVLRLAFADNGLIVLGRSQSVGLGIALRRLLAHHVAMRVRACLGLLALESADRIRAHGLTLVPQVVVAHEATLRLFAAGLALGPRLAVQSLLATADVILRAIHRAHGLVTVDVAALQLVLVHLRASGLAVTRLAHGFAILLTHRLGAVPRAMRYAALPHVIRQQLLTRSPVGVPLTKSRSALVPGHRGLLGHHSASWCDSALLAGHRVEILRALLRQGDRNPDVSKRLLSIHNVGSLVDVPKVPC
mmetsp:Transcript_12610/g.30103  ORF Transcript_12610/g.30103 Transcript_12610/m.30103 type:complete len:277 (+) Transcript_12610:709-1539(+)